MYDYDDDHSFHSDEEIDDPTRCYCGAQERPVEVCGTCLEYRTWHAAAREVSAMDAPTALSIPLVEFGLLMGRFDAATNKDMQVVVVEAITHCARRHPDFMVIAAEIRVALRQRCVAWGQDAPQIAVACQECIAFLDGLYDRPDRMHAEYEGERLTL